MMGVYTGNVYEAALLFVMTMKRKKKRSANQFVNVKKSLRIQITIQRKHK